MRRRTVVLVILGASLAACQRTPAEPSMKPTETVTQAQVASAKAPERCITKTPAASPPAVTLGPAPGCPADPDGPPMLQRADVVFANGARVTAELAKTPAQNERGLMFRTHMDEDRGMLFSLGERKNHVFWMHNTCIPLDMLFIDDDGLIVGIVENAPTLNDEERQVGCPSSFVLETNAGWSRRHGVKAGQTVTIPDLAR